MGVKLKLKLLFWAKHNRVVVCGFSMNIEEVWMNLNWVLREEGFLKVR